MPNCVKMAKRGTLFSFAFTSAKKPKKSDGEEEAIESSEVADGRRDATTCSSVVMLKKTLAM